MGQVRQVVFNQQDTCTLCKKQDEEKASLLRD